jgi:hypothetical protein
VDVSWGTKPRRNKKIQFFFPWVQGMTGYLANSLGPILPKKYTSKELPVLNIPNYPWDIRISIIRGEIVLRECWSPLVLMIWEIDLSFVNTLVRDLNTTLRAL